MSVAFVGATQTDQGNGCSGKTHWEKFSVHVLSKIYLL